MYRNEKCVVESTKNIDGWKFSLSKKSRRGVCRRTFSMTHTTTGWLGSRGYNFFALAQLTKQATSRLWLAIYSGEADEHRPLTLFSKIFGLDLLGG
jgi:hypothetical protein